MRVLSLFSGVGGFDMGLEAAGMRTVFQCEIDPHCQQTLRHHWPDVPKWDDVSTLTGAHILSQVEGVDVVAWGSPCQDLSVAGKRAGLAGERSGLFHQGVRIIKELREESNGKYPTWSIWENVAGALSSNGGADFGEVLSEMDESGACFSEWAILDAQFFGVPQRRRRVFVLSCFDSATAQRCPEPLLPVGESRARDSAKGKPTRQDAPGEVAGCLRSGGAGGVPTSRGEHLVVEPPILIDRAAFNQGERTVTDVVGTLSPGAHPGGLNGQDAYSGQLVMEPTLSFDTQFGSNANVFEDVAPTMKASQQSPSVAYDEPIAFWGKDHGADAGPISPTLRASNSVTANQTAGSCPAIASGMVVRRLTPVECERLMGWPDNHTLPRADGKTNSDTTRYKMCGNGVASPVAQWIGEQLMKITDGNR